MERIAASRADRRRAPLQLDGVSPGGRLGRGLPPLTLAAATCIGVLALPGSSLASHRFVDQPPGLTGEHLAATVDGSSFFVPGTCYSGGTAQSRFTFTGTATGPYPGTYTETGTLSYSLRTLDSGEEVATGPLTGFSATVTITSPAATVVLAERFGARLNADQDAHCYESAGGTSFATDALRPTYAAVITTARGRFRDHGSVGEALSSALVLGGSVSNSSETADLTSAGPTHHRAKGVSVRRGEAKVGGGGPGTSRAARSDRLIVAPAGYGYSASSCV